MTEPHKAPIIKCSKIVSFSETANQMLLPGSFPSLFGADIKKDAGDK
jgi:hypothetical protein